MSSPFQKKEPPISHAERPRLERALQKLPSEQRQHIVATLNEHHASRHIQSLQRKGSCLVLMTLKDKKETANVYDFGELHIAQSALTALTDCLRTERIAVRVLPATSE